MAAEPLERKELSRRIKAARELRGLSQAKLNDLFDSDGLDKYTPARIERGELAMQRAHREAFQRHLRVPEGWLTEPSVDVVVGYEDPEERQVQLTAIQSDLRELQDALTRQPDFRREIHEAFEDYARRLGPQVGKRPPRSRRSQDPPAAEPPAAA